MKVFVTGASGFVGSAVVAELLAADHQVVGLARSDSSAAAITAMGAELQRGGLDDLASLRSAAADADGVIHTAFIHDFSNMAAAVEADRRAIEAMGDALAGSDRPLVVSSALGVLKPGGRGTEEDAVDRSGVGGHRIVSEEATLAQVGRGVRASIVRLPQVHGEGDHAFVPALIAIARAKRVSAYPGDGQNCWPAVYRPDAARLYRLALEHAPAGARLHAVGEEGVPLRQIAELIGRHLQIPVVSLSGAALAEHFGWMAPFVAMGGLGSSALTQQLLGWHPSGPSLLADLDHDYYFKS